MNKLLIALILCFSALTFLSTFIYIGATNTNKNLFYLDNGEEFLKF